MQTLPSPGLHALGSYLQTEILSEEIRFVSEVKSLHERSLFGGTPYEIPCQDAMQTEKNREREKYAMIKQSLLEPKSSKPASYTPVTLTTVGFHLPYPFILSLSVCPSIQHTHFHI